MDHPWKSPLYEEFIPPLTAEEIEEQRRKAREERERKHPHLRVKIDNYREVWSRVDLKRITVNLDMKTTSFWNTVSLSVRLLYCAISFLREL